jgi:hypothetical protein
VKALPRVAFYQSTIASILGSVLWKITLSIEISPCIKQRLSLSDLTGELSGNQ